MPLPGADSGNPAVAHPLGQVAFGSSSGDDWAKAVTELVVDSALAPTIDVARVTFAAGTQFPSPAVDDEGSIALGYEDSGTAVVFTGTVDELTVGIDGTLSLTAINGGAALSRLRINASFEQQKAGDVVADLIGRVGVDSDTVEDGIEFPYLVVDDRVSAYRHIADLAACCGFLAFFTVEDKISFAPFVASQAVAQFSYGKDILTFHTTSTSSRVARVTAIGEGAASAEGMDAWCWLVKDASSVTAEAGQGEPSMAIASPAWRTSDAARSAAEGFLALHTQGQMSGRLLVPGAPAVVVGSAVEIADAPGDGQNGLFLVHRVIHRFSKSAGFLTEIRIGGAGQGG